MSLIGQLRCVGYRKGRSVGRFRMGTEVPAKPIGRQAGDSFERAGFSKEVGRAGHDFQPLFAAKFRKRFLVQPDHRVIVSTHDEQRRCANARQRNARQVGAPTAGDDRRYSLGVLCRRDQRCCRTGESTGETLPSPRTGYPRCR